MADSLQPEKTTLTFVADYEGKTLAVDEETGNLYRGTFELTVNRGDANGEDNIAARIINLKDVYGSSTRDWSQRDSRDAGTIFLSATDIDGSITAECSPADGDAPSIRFGCRAIGARDGTLTGSATISGGFVGDVHSEGPLGVLGTWSSSETAANGLDCKASFGADLKP